MDRDRRLCELMGMDYPQRKLHDPDFSLPEWRAKLMDFCVEQEWWERFYKWAWFKRYAVPGDDRPSMCSGDWDFFCYLWRNLPGLIVEYHGEGR